MASTPRDQTPFIPEGVFPLLKLPGHLRKKIYGLVLQEQGTDSVSFDFKGKIDTAILYTCRQINEEARHIALDITRFAFGCPFDAFYFLAVTLAPHQRDLVGNLDFQIHGVLDIDELPLGYLIEELGKSHVKHLSVAVFGAVRRQRFTQNCALENHFLELEGLESFRLMINSGIIEREDRRNLEEAMKQRLIKGGTIVQMRTLKRTASRSIEDMQHERPAKEAKTSPIVS